jgi:hypothetical protein
MVRATQIVLLINALLATIASSGMAFGFLPHVTAEPSWHRAAAGEFAGVLICTIAALRLRKDVTVIVFPLAFVACQLAATIFDLIKGGGELPPLIPETIFFLVYLVFAARARSTRFAVPA